jgi:NAD(P)H-dependent FMN reductase
MTRIAVILGSIRPGRRGEQVARWVMDHARRVETVPDVVDIVLTTRLLKTP